MNEDKAGVEIGRLKAKIEDIWRMTGDIDALVEANVDLESRIEKILGEEERYKNRIVELQKKNERLNSQISTIKEIYGSDEIFKVAAEKEALNLKIGELQKQAKNRAQTFE